MRYLSQQDLQQVLDMPTTIELMRSAFRQLSNGQAQVPVREHLQLADRKTEALFMPVYLPEQGRIGQKIVGMNPDNLSKGLPLIQAMILVQDAATGQMLGMMDGTWITALRTGAGSGLATALFAPQEAKTLAIFGTGVQARTQVEAVCAVRPIERLLIYFRTLRSAEAFGAEMAQRLGLSVSLEKDHRRLVEAEIICTATTAHQPLFSHADLNPRCHINAVGAYRPDMAEIPPATIAAAQVIVDQKAACLQEAGDLIQAADRTDPALWRELGEWVDPTISPVVSSPLTVFKSVGNAAQDLAVAHYALEATAERGLGIELPG